MLKWSGVTRGQQKENTGSHRYLEISTLINHTFVMGESEEFTRTIARYLDMNENENKYYM